MSMLSAQCDELRRLARTLDTRYRYADNIAAALREAADTIWELRCRLVDAEDRIRKSGELCKLCEREAENAKLRECLQDLAEHIREDDGFGLDYGWMLDRMREFGVEVAE